jgi:hypothetical protein
MILVTVPPPFGADATWKILRKELPPGDIFVTLFPP